ncbi:uncharacterized protein LOC134834676 isoform X2 [Culicoides brevitarsis]|uniref:uncharacterized protein LOC134834676 isoform X2 n=1 Tax=Culicoides brevitarsis TaxID=469753 RepID=UPI00307B566A
MSPVMDTKNPEFVYLMGKNYQKIKFPKHILECNKIFRTIIREIELNLEEKCSIVIFLPTVKIAELQELVKFVAQESSQALKTVNRDLERILLKLQLIAGLKDPEEVAENVELPSEEWLKIVDNFITNEYPELKIEPISSDSTSKEDNEALAGVKKRALEYLAPKMQENQNFIGKFCIFSLIEAILPGFESRTEQLTPTLMKHFITWKEFEFSGVGSKLVAAKNDAAVFAVNRLLDINLKIYTPLSKTKLVSDLMPKIRLDKVSSRYFEEVFEMSVQLPNGQIVRRRGHSLHNAKAKVFLLASKLLATERKLSVERFNKQQLIDFYHKNTAEPSSPLGNLDPTLIIKEALRDFNQNDVKFDRDALRKSGLERMKPYLTENLFKKLTSEQILVKFLPEAVVTATKKSCSISYEDLKWSFEAASKREATENAVNAVLKELFGIELVPLFFQNHEELKEKLASQVLTARNGNKWTSSIAIQGTIISKSDTKLEKSKKAVLNGAISLIAKKHEDDGCFMNRIEFAKCYVNKKSPLLERIQFILTYFTLEQINQNIRFEPTDWLLSSFERTLLDEINQNIHVYELSDRKFKSYVRVNNKLVSATDLKPHAAKKAVIVQAFKEIEKFENKLIVVSKPFEMEKVKKIVTVTIEKKSKTAPKISNRDIIASYRKKALELLYSDRFKKQTQRGPHHAISPLCLLHNVISPSKVIVLQETQLGPYKFESTIEIANKAVTGSGVSKKEAKQDAGRLAFLHILKIDWDRAVCGIKQD